MSYTYTNYKDAVIDSTKDPSISTMLTIRTLLNKAVRAVVGDIDLRSLKRKSALAPNLFTDVWDYSAPSDLKDDKVIDIITQLDRPLEEEWNLTTPEEFDRRKLQERRLIAVDEFDGSKKLRISASVDDDTLVVSELDSLSENGKDWAVVGDATNIRIDTDNYVKGSASIKYDIGSGGTTTAGIYHDDLGVFDLTDYLDNGSIFVWAYVTSVTDLTNFIIRIGSSSSNYYYITITTQSDGTAFRAGWNLLRFSFSSRTETGTVDDDNCNYVYLYMTKAAGKINEVDYRFDQIQVKNGKYYDLKYYSEYGWKTSAGVWIEASTTDTDILNAGSSEFDLLTSKGKELLAIEMKDYNEAAVWKEDYKNKKQEYMLTNPSEAKLLTNTYWEL